MSTIQVRDVKPATARSHTYPQFTAILATAAGVQNYVDIRVRTDISFITKLPLAVVSRRVEDVGIAEVECLIYDVLGIGI